MAEDGAVRTGHRGARSAARALALALIAGALLSTFGGEGVARILRAAGGYVDFGYVPQQCGTSTSYARALNGDPVRVCQHDAGFVYAFYAGHPWYPIGDSDTTFYVAMPDAKRHFGWINEGSNATGSWLSFSRPLFADGGVMRYSGIEGSTKYLDVTQTTRPLVGSAGYTQTWTVTNTSGVQQRIRPLVASTSYGSGAPDWATATAPRRITARNPSIGGSITLSEYTGDGSPAVSGFTAGSWTRRHAATTPAAPALDNALHADATTASHDAEMALAWPIVTLAANATARYSVSVGLQRPREVELALGGAAPSMAGPTTLNATIWEDRSLNGRSLRWESFGRNGAKGSAAIDSNGKTSFAVPSQPGLQRVVAYADINDSGFWDSNEPYRNAYVWVPPGAPVPAPTVVVPAQTVVPTPPSAPPAPQKLERVVVTLGFFLDKSRFTTFAVKEVPAGSTVTASCPKGCARKTYTKRNARGTVSLKPLVGKKRMRAGTTITVTVSRPGAIAAVKIFKMRSGKRQPQVTTRCLPPGARKPVGCE
ncbi:hypothetical protein [Solirubrobacter soli]|uniref:hypothetical protein n=1 Tax=Solirubrobacter soli TaxID=363832 RepID=UPI00041739C0|nr:hypothetical protein [Solirubrobacter soli]